MSKTKCNQGRTENHHIKRAKESCNVYSGETVRRTESMRCSWIPTQLKAQYVEICHFLKETLTVAAVSLLAQLAVGATCVEVVHAASTSALDHRGFLGFRTGGCSGRMLVWSGLETGTRTWVGMWPTESRPTWSPHRDQFNNREYHSEVIYTSSKHDSDCRDDDEDAAGSVVMQKQSGKEGWHQSGPISRSLISTI